MKMESLCINFYTMSVNIVETIVILEVWKVLLEARLLKSLPKNN